MLETDINLHTHPRWDEHPEFKLDDSQFDHLIAPRRIEHEVASSPVYTHGRKTSGSHDIGAFDSDGELTEEEGGSTSAAEMEAATANAGGSRSKRRRSRSVRTTKSEAAQNDGPEFEPPDDDVEMEDAEEQESISESLR